MVNEYLITVYSIIAEFQTEHICVRGAPLLIKVYKVNLVALKSILDIVIMPLLSVLLLVL